MSNVREPEPDRPSHKQVRLKIWHPGCWTLETTEELPGTRITENALYPSPEWITADLSLRTAGRVSIRKFIDTIETHKVVESVTVLTKLKHRARVLVVYDADSSIVPQIVDADFVPIEPVSIADGFEHWTVMARSDRFGEHIHTLQRDFKVEIESINGFTSDSDIAFAGPIDRIGHALSSRQIECLLEAFHAGYYDWPREVAASDVAETLDISNPTFLEHLRLAEAKIMDIVIEDLVAVTSV